MPRECKNKRLNPQQRKLCEQHMPLARGLAAMYVKDRSLPSGMFDEIHASAWMGLVDACSRWDELRGVKFESFATRRILGQIVDDMRTSRGRGDRRSTAGELAVRARESRDRLNAAVSLSAPTGDDIKVGDLLSYESNHEERIGDDSEVSRLLARFKLHHRFAYRMVHGHGYTMEETGKLIGLSESRISQILSNMQRQLEASHVE